MDMHAARRRAAQEFNKPGEIDPAILGGSEVTPLPELESGWQDKARGAKSLSPKDVGEMKQSLVAELGSSDVEKNRDQLPGYFEFADAANTFIDVAGGTEVRLLKDTQMDIRADRFEAKHKQKDWREERRAQAEVNQKIIDAMLAFKQDEERCAAMWDLFGKVWDAYGLEPHELAAQQVGLAAEVASKQSVDKYLKSLDKDGYAAKFSSAEQDVIGKDDIIVETPAGAVGLQVKAKGGLRNNQEPWVELNDSTSIKEISIRYSNPEDLFSLNSGARTRKFDAMITGQLDKSPGFLKPKATVEDEIEASGGRAAGMLRDMMGKGQL